MLVNTPLNETLYVIDSWAVACILFCFWLRKLQTGRLEIGQTSSRGMAWVTHTVAMGKVSSLRRLTVIKLLILSGPIILQNMELYSPLQTGHKVRTLVSDAGATIHCMLHFVSCQHLADSTLLTFPGHLVKTLNIKVWVNFLGWWHFTYIWQLCWEN